VRNCVICDTSQILFLLSLKNQVGGECSTCVEEERCVHVFGGESWRKGTT
jgi:hypothetical protein